MPERDLGQVMQLWVGVVVDVSDPHQSGRVKVRVMGRHDDRANIPDSGLPWAQVMQPVTSAAIGRMGTAPVGLVRGSRVIGCWADGTDHQYPIVMGTLGRAGDAVPGQTEEGAPAVNTATGSIPAASQNSAFNAYTSLNNNGRVTIREIDSGQTPIFSVGRNIGANLTKAVERNMLFSTVPTIASIDRDVRTGVLQLMRRVDPNSLMSALPCFTASFINIDAIVSMVNNLRNMVVQAVRNAIMGLVQRLGLGRVLGLLGQAIRAAQNIRALISSIANIRVCGVNPLNQLSPTFNPLAAADFAIASVVAELSSVAATVRGGISAVVGTATGVASDLTGLVGGAIVGTATTAARTVDSAVNSLIKSVPVVPLARVVTANSTRPMSSLVVQQAPEGYTQQYYSYDRDPYPGFIEWRPLSGTGDSRFTQRNGQPNFSSAQDHVTWQSQQSLLSTLGPSISTGSLSLTSLTTAIGAAATLTQRNALSAVLGPGAGAAALAAGIALLIPTVARSIQGTFQSNFKGSILSSDVSQAVNQSAQSQAVLARQAQNMRVALGRPPAEPPGPPQEAPQETPPPPTPDPYLSLPSVADVGSATPEQQAAAPAAATPTPTASPPVVQNQTVPGEVFSPSGTII